MQCERSIDAGNCLLRPVVILKFGSIVRLRGGRERRPVSGERFLGFLDLGEKSGNNAVRQAFGCLFVNRKRSDKFAFPDDWAQFFRHGNVNDIPPANEFDVFHAPARPVLQQTL
ncbi:hypothetical protein [Mesorhizobium sp. A556]